MGKFDLKHFDYQMLPSLSYKDEEELSDEVREEIIKDVSINGGHLSSNLGVVDLTIALLKVFDPINSDIIFDVGHQCYTYKILTGRDLSSLRKKNGPSGFQKLGESVADKFESGHSGSSIPVALGMAAAKKAKGDNSPTIAVIGDASIANGLAFEGINSLDPKVYGKVIIVLNDNNMSISKPQGSLSKFFNKVRTSVFYQNGAGRFKKLFNHNGVRWIYKSGVYMKNIVKRTFTQPNLFSNFNCVYLGPINGHNFKKMDAFFNRAKSIEGNVIIHAKTVKGKGYSYAEEDESGYWHSTPPFTYPEGTPINSHEDMISLSNLSGKFVLEKMDEDPKCVIISPAMQKGSHLEEAFNKYPSRCFDVGIAEDMAIDLAAGLALKGMHPIISIYSTFMQRGYDQLINDLCRMELPVLVLIERCGLIGADGSSHQGIFDVAMVDGMPNSIIKMPYSADSLKSDIDDYKFDTKGPMFIRLERDYVRKQTEFIKDGADSIISKKENCSLGLVLIGIEGELAYTKYSTDVNAVLFNKIKPIDEKSIEFLKGMKTLLVFDPTGTEDGFASYLSLQLVKQGYKGKIEVMALKGKFIPHATKKEQIEDNKLGLDDLDAKIKELL